MKYGTDISWNITKYVTSYTSSERIAPFFPQVYTLSVEYFIKNNLYHIWYMIRKFTKYDIEKEKKNQEVWYR